MRLVEERRRWRRDASPTGLRRGWGVAGVPLPWSCPRWVGEKSSLGAVPSALGLWDWQDPQDVGSGRGAGSLQLTGRAALSSAAGGAGSRIGAALEVPEPILVPVRPL